MEMKDRSPRKKRACSAKEKREREEQRHVWVEYVTERLSRVVTDDVAYLDMIPDVAKRRIGIKFTFEVNFERSEGGCCGGGKGKDKGEGVGKDAKFRDVDVDRP